MIHNKNIVRMFFYPEVGGSILVTLGPKTLNPKLILVELH